MALMNHPMFGSINSYAQMKAVEDPRKNLNINNASQFNMSTVQGQKNFNMLSKEQKKALQEKNRIAEQTSSEAGLRNLLKQRPDRKSALGTSESQAFKSEAYGTGPLAEYESQRAQARQAFDQGKQSQANKFSDEQQNSSISQAGQQANAYSQLAQGGGLSGGARERIASSLGSGNLMNQQAARLSNQRAMQDQENTLASGLLDLTGKEAEQRRSMQNAYMTMQQSDITGENQAAQDRYNKQADVEAGILKARSDAAIAAANKKK
jgi:hypothetical protein